MKRQQRGLGFVYQRKTGLRWWIQYNSRGKCHRESSRLTNRADAVKLLRQRISEVQAGKTVGNAVNRTTFDDLANLILDDYNANGRKGVRRLGYALKPLREFFSAETLAVNLTPDRATKYAVHRQSQGIANATINNELNALKRAFTLALRAGKVAARPHIALLHVDNARQGFFVAAEYRAVLAALPEYLRPVIQVGYATGWRITSELLTRTWKNVDLKDGWLRLEPGEGKTGQGREFPLASDLLALFQAQREYVRQIERAQDRIIPWVFVHPDGSRIRDFRTAWKAACKMAAVAGRIPHDLRRTAVRNLERAGVPRSAAMKMTGHKTESVYRRYAIVDESMLHDAVAKLAALHASDRTI